MKETTTYGLKAFDSTKTRGRIRPGVSHSTDPYIADLIAATNSPFVRRLAKKTQVFSPTLPVTNRLTHSLVVMSIATEIAYRTGLNVPMVQAIAMLHDIGHTPISHLGERCITKLSGRTFRHEIMSVNIAKIDINASHETLVGIKMHSRGTGEMSTDASVSQEYIAVMYADKIAYVFNDIRDALKIDFIKSHILPVEYQFLDQKTCIDELVKESLKQGHISFSHCETAKQFAEIRTWLFANLYKRIDLTKERQAAYSDMCKVYDFLDKNKSLLGLDPLISLIIMDDEEMLRLAAIIPIFEIKHIAMVSECPWAELHDQLIGINLFDCDLNPELFS